MPRFETPTVNVTPMAPPGTRGLEARLFRHYRPLKKGISVLQGPDGSWYVKEYPTQDEIDVALNFFLGGHVYPISDAVAASLTAAGFGSLVTQ